MPEFKLRGPGKYRITQKNKLIKIPNPDILSATSGSHDLPDNWLSVRPGNGSVYMYHAYKRKTSTGMYSGRWYHPAVPESSLKGNVLKHKGFRLTLSARATRKVQEAYAKQNQKRRMSKRKV
jgi:hypothetical protein